MGATRLEFRLRMAINLLIVVLGFWAPWIERWNIGERISVLEWLALDLSRSALVRFTLAAPVVIVFGACLAALGAFLRIWGTAYLGTGTVQSPDMKASGVVADGPYRHVRNPLYLGLWFTFAALTFVMPPTGALVTMVLFTIFQLRLILGEEAFLSSQLGEPYRDYVRAVPRLVPRVRTTLPHSGIKPRWLRAVLSEINPIGVFLALAAFSWTYNNQLLVKVIVIGFGISLVVRALLPPDPLAVSSPA